MYKCTTFKEDIAKLKQILTLSGVGTHEKNGVAEQSIGTTINIVCTTMLHQALLWPE